MEVYALSASSSYKAAGIADAQQLLRAPEKATINAVRFGPSGRACTNSNGNAFRSKNKTEGTGGVGAAHKREQVRRERAGPEEHEEAGLCGDVP